MNILQKMAERMGAYYQSRKAEMYFYIFDEYSDYAVENALTFTEIKDIDSLRTYSAGQEHSLDSFLREECKRRFEDGSKMILAEENNRWVAYGWIAEKRRFWVAEIDILIDIDEADICVLYDFYTREEYRGRGIYPVLLAYMAHMYRPEKKKIVYCYVNNISSAKGMAKTGGSLGAQLTHRSALKGKFFPSYGCKVLGSKRAFFGLIYKR